MKKEYIAGLLGCLLATFPVTAEIQPIHPPTSVDAFDTAIMTSPLIAKIYYRSQWEKDNQPDYSYLVQLEEATNNPAIDSEMQKQLKKQLDIVKRIDYGLKDKPVSHFNTLDFKNQSKQILSHQIENTQIKVTSDELEKNTPSDADLENLKKELQKMTQKKPKHLGIDISDF